MELQDAANWLLSKGLTRASSEPSAFTPVAWLNGILIPVLETSPSLDQVGGAGGAVT